MRGDPYACISSSQPLINTVSVSCFTELDDGTWWGQARPPSCERNYLHDEGAITRVALEKIWPGWSPFSFSIVVFSLFSLANDLLILAVRRIVERTVKVFPSPISSANIPPNVSVGFSAVLAPVISCS